MKQAAYGNVLHLVLIFYSGDLRNFVDALSMRRMHLEHAPRRAFGVFGNTNWNTCDLPIEKPLFLDQKQGFFKSNGEGGIRTPDEGDLHTGFRIQRIQPLCHLSIRSLSIARRPRKAINKPTGLCP